MTKAQADVEIQLTPEQVADMEARFSGVVRAALCIALHTLTSEMADDMKLRVNYPLTYDKIIKTARDALERWFDVPDVNAMVDAMDAARAAAKH